MITTERDLRKMRKRITWTSFDLPSAQHWPTWRDAAISGEFENPDPYLGVLQHVPGVENVRLARRVENPEQAAYVVREFYRPIIFIRSVARVITYICGQCC
jgi:hypothetical protein